jgi:hypothetical protein
LQPVGEPPQPKTWRHRFAGTYAINDDKLTAQQQGNEPLETPKTEICGIAFGSVGHLAVLYGNGTVAVLALRPHVTSSEMPEEPLKPCPLVLVTKEEFITTGT